MSTTSNAAGGRPSSARESAGPTDGVRHDRPSGSQDRSPASGRATTATRAPAPGQDQRAPRSPGGVAGSAPRDQAREQTRDPSSAGASQAAPATEAGPRQVRLTIAHVNAWTVLRISFLLSVAIGVVLVVAVAVLWSVLDGIGVFGSVNGVIREVVGNESSFNLLDFVGLSRVLSLTVVVAVIDVVLLTLISTLGAVLYNICGALVGGVRLTLTDD